LDVNKGFPLLGLEKSEAAMSGKARSGKARSARAKQD
jgi:hypothetical protein